MKLKKILPLLLAVAMLFSIGMTAMAEENNYDNS